MRAILFYRVKLHRVHLSLSLSVCVFVCVDSVWSGVAEIGTCLVSLVALVFTIAENVQSSTLPTSEGADPTRKRFRESK